MHMRTVCFIQLDQLEDVSNSRIKGQLEINDPPQTRVNAPYPDFRVFARRTVPFRYSPHLLLLFTFHPHSQSFTKRQLA